jgi:signal peptidase II
MQFEYSVRQKAWRSTRTLIVLISLLVAIDAGAKMAARWGLAANDVELTSFLALTLRYNFGSTFGVLPVQYTTWFAALVAFGVLWFVWRFGERVQRSSLLALALFSAGGLGNAADRVVRGNVTDFIALTVGSWGSPIFNLADTYLLAGVLFLVVQPQIVRPNDPSGT